MTGTGKQRMDIHYARLHHRLEPPAALPCHADRAARPSRRVCSLQRLGPPPTRSERDEQHLVLAEAARLARSMPWAGITWASGCSAGSSGCSPTLTVPVSSWSATPSCSSRRWCRMSTTGSVAPPKSSGHRLHIHGSNDGTRNERDYPVQLVTSYRAARARISSRRGASGEPSSFAFSYQLRAITTSGATPWTLSSRKTTGSYVFPN